MPDTSRTICVEFFGIVRARTGVPEAAIEFATDTITLREILAILARQFPAFGSQCVHENSLGAGLAANVRGERFLRSNDDVLVPGDTVLIFSSDAGG